MQYISTRGLESSFSFSDILFEGYAEDGGLYVPAVFPKVDAHTLMTWRGLSYASLAFEVIRLFAEELPKEDLWQICSEAYQAGNFGHTRGMVHGRGDHAREVAPRPGRPARAFERSDACLRRHCPAVHVEALRHVVRPGAPAHAARRHDGRPWGLRPRPRSAGTRTSRSSCFPRRAA